MRRFPSFFLFSLPATLIARLSLSRLPHYLRAWTRLPGEGGGGIYRVLALAPSIQQSENGSPSMRSISTVLRKIGVCTQQGHTYLSNCLPACTRRSEHRLSVPNRAHFFMINKTEIRFEKNHTTIQKRTHFLAVLLQTDNVPVCPNFQRRPQCPLLLAPRAE